MATHKILDFYVISSEEMVTELNPKLKKGIAPEGYHIVINAIEGYVDMRLLQNLSIQAEIVILNVGAPIVSNLIQVCEFCAQKEYGLALLTNNEEHYNEELPQYRKYISTYWSL